MAEKMIRVGILGASGYTGLELLRILLRHPNVEIAALTTRSDERPHLSSVHPQLANRLDLHLENYSSDEIAERVDLAFCCLPHAASAEMIAKLLKLKIRVVDFSADYRLDEVETFEHWYRTKHPDPARLGNVPYGLPELNGALIPSTEVVANPGCFPTSAILAMAPLLHNKIVDASDIIVDSKTGVSGAGRTPKLGFHYPECNESIAAYNVGMHRHSPEMKQVLSKIAGEPVGLVFTPHLVPMDRGILTTAYSNQIVDKSLDQIYEIFENYYSDKPFVRISRDLPKTKNVSGTNFCDLAIRQVNQKIVVISCIDNLIKGASGMAVQNFNLMFGFDETTALIV